MDSHRGSDFSPVHFTFSQNRYWTTLLIQLRAFEATVCETVRELENKVENLEISRNTESRGNCIILEEKVELYGDMLRQLDKGMEEQLLALEVELSLANSRIIDMEIVVAGVGKENPEVNPNEAGTTRNLVAGPSIGNVEGKFAEMQRKIAGIYQTIAESNERIEVLEEKVLDEDDGFIWNGHENVDGENNLTMDMEREPNDEEQERPRECEIMISDPFLLSGSHLAPYDGNPSVSFSRWAQKFRDLLSLYTTQLTDDQQISRLRFCLTGPARAELDSMARPPDTLERAFTHLLSKFENDNTKSIARQVLAICRQYPGEKVFDFATRLSEAVRTALAGETEQMIRKRLLEEFLDRLIPELQYEVKSERPTEYSKAYELAQHYELLQAARKPNSSVAIGELAERVEALAMQNVRQPQNQSNERRLCFYCKKPGHIIRDCMKRKRETRTSDWGGDRRNQNQGNSGGYEPYERNNDRNRERMGYRQNRQTFRRNDRSTSRGREEGWARREPEHNNRNARPSTPRVNFGGGRIASARVASPYFFAIISFFAIMATTLGQNSVKQPMICLPDSPASLWKLPEEPICPSWQPTETPISMDLAIHRPNTLQYKTPATACKCINSKIHRRLGIFGQPIEEIETENIELPTSTCFRMKDLNHSPAGELNKNGTLRFTNHSLEVGWKMWPVGVFWQKTEVLNCYTFDTIVFTRYGVEGVSTPLNSCPGCQYKSGACRCEQSSMIWAPDPTQQCPFIGVAKWSGEYSTNVWISGTNDFALTFENITVRKNCNDKEFAISDQGFAVPLEEYQEMMRKRDLARKENTRLRRQLEQITQDATLSKENSPVGVIYSSQLSAQLTALSAKLSQTTQRLFSEAIRQICTSLQSIADQTSTLAIANPTLLARYFLKNQLITARLVSETALEIRPCFGINVQEMHYNWKKGFCFNRLPVTFVLYGSLRHGFLDTITNIIYPEAREIDCHSGRWLYLAGEKKLVQYDQSNGDIKEVPWEAIHKIARYGNIDIPEIGFTVFKNKVMANLSELYSPEHFTETLEAAEIHQEIVRLTRPNGAWSESSAKPEFLAGNIVSNGLFSFLRGGIFSANQIWVFCVCCYVTASAVLRFVLPPFLAELVQYFNLGGSIVHLTRTIQNNHRRKCEQTREIENENRFQTARRKAIPLTQRWQTEREGNPPWTNGSVVQTVEVAVTEVYQCDGNSRIEGQINGEKVRVLIDTGAHISLCGLEMAKTLKLNRVHQPEVGGITGIGAGVVQALGQANILLNLAGCQIETPLVLIQNEVSKNGHFDVILGRKTIRELPLLLDFETGKLIQKRKMEECAQSKSTGSASENFWGKAKELNPCDMANPCDKATNDLTTREELAKFLACLRRNEDVFAKHNYDLGECTISAPPLLTTTEVPVYCRPYRVPEKYQEELNYHLEEMLKVGVLEESNTPWVSPVVIVQKADGNLRPCVDFRALNKITVTDPYPIPKMETVLHKVAGKEFYSTLDLAAGFWQIPLDEKTSQKCGIITEKGVYAMKKLPFGLKNSPAIFQRIMNEVLSGIEQTYAYIDDIIIYTDTFENHLETLEKVFKRIRKHKLKLKPQKCSFFKRSIGYLGHKLSKQGYEPSMSNKETIERFPEPKNVKEIKRFLGLVGFFRKFIPSYAAKAAPLTLLLRGKEEETNFAWGPEQINAFKSLKSELTKSPSLRSPDYEAEFHLFTDASQIAWGGALMQTSGSDMYAVAYCSKILNQTESRYPPTHGELAAIVHALNIFRPIIYGSELTIYTDHKPLTFLLSKGKTNPKLNRWLLIFQDINPKIVYIEGKNNVVADALSRVATDCGIQWEEVMGKYFREETPYVLSAEKFEIDKSQIESETIKDETLSKVAKAIKDYWTEEPIGIEPFYHIRNEIYLEGKIVRKHPGQLVIPEILRIPILNALHTAHFGIVKTKSKARQLVWWPGIGKDIEDYIEACEICQRNSNVPPTTDKNRKWPEAKLCMERIHVDLAGPIWNTNFLVVVDSYSKYPWTFQMNSTNSNAIIVALREVFSQFGAPLTLVSDNGPQFISEEVELFLYENGVKHLKSPPYTPSSNGAAEKFVQTMKKGVRKLLEEKGEGRMKEVLQVFLREYRAFPCTATSESPAQLMFKREIRTPLDRIRVRMEEKRQKVITPSMPKPKDKTFELGDPVWVNINKNWRSGIVVGRQGEVIYEVSLEGEEIAERPVHVLYIKRRKPSTTRTKQVTHTNDPPPEGLRADPPSEEN